MSEGNCPQPSGSAAGKNFMSREQCAEQFEMYAKSHSSKDSQHSLRFCANFLREFCADTGSVEHLARSLAEQYSAGWKAHAEHIGEPKGSLTAREWADANWQSFEKEARVALRPKAGGSHQPSPEDGCSDPYILSERVVKERLYNPAYGSDRMCECGHPYYRHFDTHDEMRPVGCKYCECAEFVERKAQHDAGEGGDTNDD